jgi:hypothetical protein
MEAALNSPLGRTVLGQVPLKIGRAPDNTLVISDPQASAHHAEVAPGFGGASYQITDLNSTNGTFVNEQRLSPNMPHPLSSGDVIRIGTTNFTYEASGAGYLPTVAASTPNYEPTVAASTPNYEPTVAAAPPPVQPLYQQPPSTYGSYDAPVPPPPVYPQPAYPQPAYPQPAYPQPGGFGQPGYPAPRKSRAGLWVGLVILLLIIIGGGGVLAYMQLRSTPQKTLTAYCDGWKTGNAQEIYNQLDAAERAKGTVADIQSVLNTLKQAGGVTDCTVSNVQQTGSTATGVVTLSAGNGRSASETDTLIQENGTWKIDSTKLNP